MNRHFLAGASALALLAGASAANAQLTVSIDGETHVDFGYTTIEKNNATNTPEDARNTDFSQRSRLNFRVSGKSDSGLTYGIRNRLIFGGGSTAGNANGPANATNTNVNTLASVSEDIQYDHSFLFVNGAFGQVVLGNTYGIYSNSFSVADGWGTGGSDGNFPRFIGGRTGTGFPTVKEMAVGDTASSRIYYITPSFSGLTAGIGYTPTSGGRSSGRGVELNKNATTYNDTVEAVLRYQTTIDALKIDLIGAYSFGKGRPGTGATNVGETEDLSSYAFTARFDYGPFAISGTYVSNGQSGQAKAAAFKDDATSYAIFAQYTVLPELTLGASYGKQKSAGDATVAGENERTVISFGAAYTLAPGLSLRPEYVNYDFDTKEAGQRGDSGDIFIFRTLLAF